MTTVACFLRAVNVGGRRATNDELVAAATDAGFTGVHAYQAAGNLVLDDAGADESAVADRLEAALKRRLGFATEVVVRTGEELLGALAAVPWEDAAVERSVGAPQVVLCRARPSGRTATAVLALATAHDPLLLDGRDLHWLPVAGTGRTALDTTRLHALLHPATARTVGTLRRLHERFLAG